MQANYVQRLRLTFSKDGPARYIGHLDVARTLERSLNRANVPMAYTQGFNRRPRLSIAAPLPLGFTSDCELADIWLSEKLPPESVQVQMRRVAAPGLNITKIWDVALTAPSLNSELVSASYSVELLDQFEPDALREQINEMLAAGSIFRERKKKKGNVRVYDLRPLIIDLALIEDKIDDFRIDMNLQLTASGTGRPDEVLAELGVDPFASRIKRTKIRLKADS